MVEKYSIGIIIDRTGSVIAEKKMIDDSLKLMIESLVSNYSQMKEKELVVTFIGEEDFLLPHCNDIKITKLSGSLKQKKMTDYANIFEILDKISLEKGIKKIFFFSDGYLTEKDDWESFIILLNDNKKYSEIERVVIGTGEGVNENILKLFSSKGTVFQYKDTYDLI